MVVSPPETRLVFGLKRVRAAEVTVAVVRVGECAFFTALISRGSIPGAQVRRRIVPKGENLETEANMKNSVFWDVRRLLVTASVLPSSLILVTLMKEALSSSETSVLTKAIRRNIPQDGILYSHRRKNLKSYITLTGWTGNGDVMCLL
jgi:hypothetical protein